MRWLLSLLLLTACEPPMGANCDEKCGIIQGRYFYNKEGKSVCHCRTETGWEEKKGDLK